MTNHSPIAPTAASLLGRVRLAIQERGLTLGAAAKAIGVGAQTLQNHLSGEHVRSDSAQKYENWLAGRTERRNVFSLPTRSRQPDDIKETAIPAPPPSPRLVVDIFSGCGGLSLGFDLLDEGRQFRTILAIDNQSAPVAVLNRNAKLLGHGTASPGRKMDLTEFINEAEFLAFYVEHVASVSEDAPLLRSLHELANGAFPKFLAEISAADRAFIRTLNEIRETPIWRKACEALDRRAISQTSVIGFHEKLRLPTPSIRLASLPAVLWGAEDTSASDEGVVNPDAEFLDQAHWEWNGQVTAISGKSQASGRGQLSASARRVSAFVDFLSHEVMGAVASAWINWRARRLMLRTRLFGAQAFYEALYGLYSTRCHVSVLVGGPPCQGFSRIGRGKIRSLREARVQVHDNTEAGDARNLLFQQYVMVLGALRPSAFLFENVQHFQSTVKADGVEFEAAEVLAEAIANVSDGEANYDVHSRVVDASRHGVPQTRQRYFMAGVLRIEAASISFDGAKQCLALRSLPETSLGLALAGLPEPSVVGGDVGGGDAMAALAAVASGSGENTPYTKWIHQARPGSTEAPHFVDGHAARAAREDDAALFSLMGPGKRWMDYRADDSETVAKLAQLLDAVVALPDAAFSTSKKSLKPLPDRNALLELRSRVEGSLPLRLLLEQASKRLGAPHHLLGDSYLAKGDGNHGDWVSRMDASRPAKTMVSHMGKDTYAYVHPSAPRTISVREAARIQSFPDWFVLEDAALTDAFKMIGNAVPPMLSHEIAGQMASVLSTMEAKSTGASRKHTAT